jgi:hypothetical protein
MTLTIPMTPTVDSVSVADRLAALDWGAIERSLDERGHAVTDSVLTSDECEALAGLYDVDALFRSRVDMARHRFGEGEYKYFAAPLPPLVQALRAELYPPLARIANRWNDRLGDAARYPATLDAFLARCAEAGQTKPTPLVLRYEAGGYNCLHQDVYGSVAFPLQALVPLTRPGVDYTGGELLFVEQRPRAQSAGEAVLPPQGALVFFTTRTRPVAGGRGHYRVNVRHGVSRVRSGTRYTLGVIFHDAA